MNKFKIGDIVICSDFTYKNVCGPIVKESDDRVNLTKWYDVRTKLRVDTLFPELNYLTFYPSEMRLATEMERAMYE